MSQGEKTSSGSGKMGSGSVTETLASKLKSLGVGAGDQSRRGGLAHDFTHTRPESLVTKQGNSGRPIPLKANFVKMQKVCDASNLSSVLIYQYHVSFEPSVDSKSIRHRLLKEQDKSLGVIDPIFDGMILYLPRQLRFSKLLTKHPNTGEEVQIGLELTAELIPTDSQCTTFLNVTNRRVQELLGLVQIGRHFFDRSKSVAIPAHRMEVWPGYNTAIRRYEDSLLLNIDVVHKMLRQQSVLDFVASCLKEGGPRGKDMAAKELIGTSVLTRYNNKLYQVDDILWDKHPETTTFDKKDGTTLNLCQYIQEQYAHTGAEVNVTGQPLLLSRAKKRGLDGNANADILLIPELCYMTGLTEKMRADTRVMRDLATKTRIGPQQRVDSAEQLINRISGEEASRALLQSWDLEMESELVKITGRTLDAEKLIFADGRETAFDARKAEWTRECRGKKPVRGTNLAEAEWALVFPARLRPDSEKFFVTLKSEGPGLGVGVGLPCLYELPDDSESMYADACRSAATKAGARMIVAVVPNDNKQRYDAIKKVCCLEVGVPCQVVLHNTLRRDNILKSICQKILNQMTCKQGGALWRLKIPMKRVMVVGYDSYTDSSMRGKAVGAAVFSLDDDITKWFSQSKLYEDKRTESENISTFFIKALQKYRELNDCLPERLFFYRGGVGEGQLPVVYNVELDLVKAAIQKVYGSGAEDRGDVKLAFLIVNKKINTRFFAEAPGKAGTYANPPPGTVVDSVVTRVERYDFFLIPQSVNQGSVTPVAYNVIYDRSGLKADQMQRLAFKLSHLYYNWQGTIRVPSPCMYAHKLAFLTSQSTHSPAHEALHDTLFFL